MNLAGTPPICDCTYMSHPSQVWRSIKNCNFGWNWLVTLTYQRYSKMHYTIPFKTFKRFTIKIPIHLSSWHKCVSFLNPFSEVNISKKPPLPPNKKKVQEAVDDSAEKQTRSELHYEEFGRSCSRWCRQTLSVSGDKAALTSSMIDLEEFRSFSYMFIYFIWWTISNKMKRPTVEHFISRF